MLYPITNTGRWVFAFVCVWGYWRYLLKPILQFPHDPNPQSAVKRKTPMPSVGNPTEFRVF